MLSIRLFVYMFVCLSACLSVCSLLRYRLNVFLFPLPEVGCPKKFEIQNPWGKVRKEVVSHLKTFTYKGSKIAAQIMFFLGEFCKDQEVMFSDANIEPLQKTLAYKGYKITAQKKCFFFCEFCLTSRIVLVSVILSASVERCFVSCMRDFYFSNIARFKKKSCLKIEECDYTSYLD